MAQAIGGGYVLRLVSDVNRPHGELGVPVGPGVNGLQQYLQDVGLIDEVPLLSLPLPGVVESLETVYFLLELLGQLIV